MKLFSVFGNPVSHSISPRLHNKAIFDLKLNALYTRFCLKNGNELISKFKELGLSGANVTVPYKEFALNLSDEASNLAKNIGSANTLVLKNNKIFAYNTDAMGFFKSIEKFDGIKTALVIGAGGTARAISYILKENNIKVSILNRSSDKFYWFENYFECFLWDDIHIKQYDIVINSTSAGLSDECLPAPAHVLEPIMKLCRYSFDVIYGKNTPFLQLSKEIGIKFKDGKDMLLFQAVLAFNLFFDNKLSETDIEKSMRIAINL